MEMCPRRERFQNIYSICIHLTAYFRIISYRQASSLKENFNIYQQAVMQHSGVGIWECHVCTGILHQHADVCAARIAKESWIMNQGRNWLQYLNGFRLCLSSWTPGCLPAPSAEFTYWDMTQVHVSLVPTPATLRFSLAVQAEHRQSYQGTRTARHTVQFTKF